MDNRSERKARNLNLLHIRIEDFQKVICGGRLVTVLHLDPQLVWILLWQIECQAIIVSHCLDKFEQVDHIDTQDMAGGTIVLVETISM